MRLRELGTALELGVVALKWLADDDQAGPRTFEDCEG